MCRLCAGTGDAQGGGVPVPAALTPSAWVPSSPRAPGAASWAGQASTRIPRPRQDFFPLPPWHLRGPGGRAEPGAWRAEGRPPDATRASPLLTAGGGGRRGGRGGGRGRRRAVPAAGAAGREGVKARGLYDNEPPGNIGREAGRGAAPPPPREPSSRSSGAASSPAGSGRRRGRGRRSSAGRASPGEGAPASRGARARRTSPQPEPARLPEEMGP